MRKIFIFAVLLIAGYKYLPHDLALFSSKGAFDKNGKPRVVVFVGPQCADPCDKVLSALKERGVDYEELNVAGPDGAPVSNPYGISSYPVTIVGKQTVEGDDILRINAALAEAYGPEMLPRMQRAAMSNHFEADGRAKIVLYGTAWCPACKQQRNYFIANGVPFEDIDAETSEAGKLAFQTLQGGGYPLIYVGYRRFHGYHEKNVVNAMNELNQSKGKKAG